MSHREHPRVRAESGPVLKVNQETRLRCPMQRDKNVGQGPRTEWEAKWKWNREKASQGLSRERGLK